MKHPHSITKDMPADTDVARLLMPIAPKLEMAYQEHRRAAECRDAMARWPLLSDLAEALTDFQLKLPA